MYLQLKAPPKETASFIDGFRIKDENGYVKYYNHFIFSRDDDRVELQDEDRNVILTYTANCYILDADKKDVGKMSTHVGNWVGRDIDGVIRASHVDNLICEILFSKWYLNNKDNK